MKGVRLILRHVRKTFFFNNMRPVVLSGPSGGGKSTIIARAMDNFPKSFAFSVSHTTRTPRAGELNGVHYWFVSKQEFENMAKDGQFLEYADFGGYAYGTSKKAVDDVLNSGRICILDVELQGVRNIHKCGLNAKYILIRAPSINVLENRLRSRKTETEDSLKKRLKHAEEDLNAVAVEPELFDNVIVNDDLDRAYQEFLQAIENELNEVTKSSSGV